MKSVILKGLSEEAADEMRQSFTHAVYLRKQLIKVLQEKINASNRNSRSKDAYGIANWAYLQADAVGYERGMLECISLLEADIEGAFEATETRTHLTANTPQMPRKRGRPKKILP